MVSKINRRDVKEVCPECEGTKKNPLKLAEACPLCGGDGVMSLQKAFDNLSEMEGGPIWTREELE